MWKLHRNPRKLWKPGNVRREKGFSSFFYNYPVSIISVVSCIVSPFGFPGFQSFLGFVYSFAILVSTCAGLGRAPTRKAPTGCGGRPPSPEEWQPATLPCPTVGRRTSGSAAGVSQNKKRSAEPQLETFRSRPSCGALAGRRQGHPYNKKPCARSWLCATSPVRLLYSKCEPPGKKKMSHLHFSTVCDELVSAFTISSLLACQGDQKGETCKAL